MTNASPDQAVNIQHLGMLLGDAENDPDLFEAIVNLPFDEYAVATTYMFLGIIVLLLVNQKTGNIDRVTLSQTEMAARTTEVSAKPFKEIKINANDPDNIIAHAINSGQSLETTDWYDLFVPALTAEEARLNQANAGIAFSVVQPFNARGGGALIFSYYQFKDSIEGNYRQFMDEYTNLVASRLRQV